MYLDITPEAVKYMGERNGVKDFVFCVPSPHTIQNILDEWLAKAGINKRLTSHIRSYNKIFYWLNINELILKDVTANDLETSYIFFFHNFALCKERFDFECKKN